MSRWGKIIFIIIVVLPVTAVLITFLALRLPTFGGRFEGTRLVRIRESPEYKAGRFENSPPQKKDMQLLKTLQLYAQGQVREPPLTIPIVKLSASDFQDPPKPGMRAYWFGHATVLIEIDGVRIITDPIFSEYASPFSFIGPRRFHPPPLALEKLPRIDAVLISHDHYDHLDMKSVQQLGANGSHFYVGLGVGAHLERWNISEQQIHELDWWKKAHIGMVEIHCTPARHYSGRKSMDNSTLWASWFVKGWQHSIYHSGDTGYASHFREIKGRLGPPQFTLMKVGAYGTPWLDIHMNPESAVKAHSDIGGQVMLPIHWATFNLAYHAWEEPILRTLAAAKTSRVAVVTPRVGEKVEYGENFINTSWYKGTKQSTTAP